MGKTTFTTSDALKKKAYEEKLFRDIVKETYFSKFQGEGADSIVQVKTQLEKGKGDQIQFGLRMRLSGDGIEEGEIMEGNEEKLTTYDYSLTLKQYRHAVRDDGAMTRQRVMFSIDDESEKGIKDWGAEKLDELQFTAIQASPTKVFYREASAGAFTGTTTLALAKAGITSTTYTKIDLNFISKLKTWALTGGNRSYIPLSPAKVSGKSYFVLLVPPDVMCDLKIDSTFQQAMREAEVRGKENPLFTGALAIWDGVVIHEHENMDIGTDGGSGAIAWGQGVLLGKQALCFAWGKRPRIVYKEFDYENEHGYCWDAICATGKPVFNSKDFGSLACVFARTNISGT